MLVGTGQNTWSTPLIQVTWPSSSASLEDSNRTSIGKDIICLCLGLRDQSSLMSDLIPETSKARLDQKISKWLISLSESCTNLTQTSLLTFTDMLVETSTREFYHHSSTRCSRASSLSTTPLSCWLRENRSHSWLDKVWKQEQKTFSSTSMMCQSLILHSPQSLPEPLKRSRLHSRMLSEQSSKLKKHSKTREVVSSQHKLRLNLLSWLVSHSRKTLHFWNWEDLKQQRKLLRLNLHHDLEIRCS